MLSAAGILGGGAYYQALAKAEQGGAPVYHYLVSYDSILPGAVGKRCAWHTADLPLQNAHRIEPGVRRLSCIMAQRMGGVYQDG